MSRKSAVAVAIGELRAHEAELQAQLEDIQTKLAALAGTGKLPARKGKASGKRRLSAEGRAAIGRAAKKRWAAYRKAKRAGK